MDNNTFVPACNAPFLAESWFPSIGGDIAGRFCANLTQQGAELSCCLPCPMTSWTYSDTFPKKARVANYLSIVSLVLNVFLLLTFAVLPEEQSHRHYLSIGLSASLILIAIAFIIPLGTEPDLCHNVITPNDMNTDLSCAFTGAIVQVGAMGIVVWIALRSIWTALRIMANFRNTELFKSLSIYLGCGLPILFLAISLPISGVSYNLGNVCVPSNPAALPTWFAWVLLFATVSWIIQIITILYCLWRFASFSFAGPQHDAGTSQNSIPKTTSTTDSEPPLTPLKQLPIGRRRRVAWRRVRNILLLQWRSMVMAFILVNLTVYFGIVFIEHTAASWTQIRTRGPTVDDLTWIACLMANDGDKNRCPYKGSGWGHNEARAVATLMLASLIGIIVFLLAVRTSMFIGWWTLTRNPRQFFRKPSIDSQDLLIGGRHREPEKLNTSEEAHVESVPDLA